VRFEFRVRIDAIDTTGIEGARTTFKSMDFIPFFKEKLREVGSVLSRDTSD